MARGNFDWIGSSKENCALELIERNICRTVQGPPRGMCVVCGKQAHKADRCYFSNKLTGVFAKYWGHKECCDREKSKSLAVEAGTYAKEAVGLIKPLPVQKILESPAELTAELNRLRGWQEGVREMLKALRKEAGLGLGGTEE